MAHSLSARKRMRQNVKRKARNRWRLRAMRSSIKEFMDKLAHASAADAEKAFRAVSKAIDRGASNGTIHKNQAARRKSRLSKRLKAKVGTKTK